MLTREPPPTGSGIIAMPVGPVANPTAAANPPQAIITRVSYRVANAAVAGRAPNGTTSPARITTTIALPGTYFPRWLMTYARIAAQAPTGAAPELSTRQKYAPKATSPATYRATAAATQAGSSRIDSPRACRSRQVRAMCRPANQNTRA